MFGGALGSERPGDGEPGLLGELLGAATAAEGSGQLATRSALLGRYESGVDLGASLGFADVGHGEFL